MKSNYVRINQLNAEIDAIARKMTVGSIVAMLAIAVLCFMGCITADIPDITLPTLPPVATTTTTTVPPATTIPPVTGDWAGDYLDDKASGEVAVGGWKGFQLRYSANDSEKYKCAGEWYPIKPSLVGAAFSGVENEDGTLTLTATDFVTPAGHKYKFIGFCFPFGKEKMRTENPCTVPKSDRHDALRVHWATVK